VKSKKAGRQEGRQKAKCLKTEAIGQKANHTGVRVRYLKIGEKKIILFSFTKPWNIPD
jgi:hypothetical protein